jgi:hypothetical protein
MDTSPDLPPLLRATEERRRDRLRSLLRYGAAAPLGILVSCGGCWLLIPDLCAEEDVVRTSAPGGGAEARTFLWNCGATTGYVNTAMLRVDGWLWNHEAELYRSEPGGLPQLSWAAPNRLVVDCSQCAEMPADFVYHGISVSYVRHTKP